MLFQKSRTLSNLKPLAENNTSHEIVSSKKLATKLRNCSARLNENLEKKILFPQKGSFHFNPYKEVVKVYIRQLLNIVENHIIRERHSMKDIAAQHPFLNSTQESEVFYNQITKFPKRHISLSAFIEIADRSDYGSIKKKFDISSLTIKIEACLSIVKEITSCIETYINNKNRPQLELSVCIADLKLCESKLNECLDRFKIVLAPPLDRSSLPESDATIYVDDVREIIQVSISDAPPFDEPLRNPDSVNTRLTKKQLKQISLRIMNSHQNSKKRLNLSGLDLPFLPKGLFSNLKHVEYLTLENNKLESIENNAFDGLPNLKWVRLKNNKLTSLNPDLFKLHKSLTIICLDENDITKIDLAAFKSELRKFDIHITLEGNPLNTLFLDTLRNENRSLRVHSQRVPQFTYDPTQYASNPWDGEIKGSR
jgi:hypothetical protein